MDSLYCSVLELIQKLLVEHFQKIFDNCSIISNNNNNNNNIYTTSRVLVSFMDNIGSFFSCLTVSASPTLR
jgi:hypothetical protein